MSARFPSSLGLAVLLAILGLSSYTAAWSNGGYSADPANPDYGTHDWIAQHALDWLPAAEKAYITDRLARYLYGTELPDNGGAPDGIGDTTLHHVYYRSSGILQDDASADRAEQEYATALANLRASDFPAAAKAAGILSHYVVDVAVFGHVMGASTDWGAEVHHSDYETYVTDRMTTYASTAFEPYLAFDGTLEAVTAYTATLRVAYNTTFGDGAATKDCVWMDANYDWTDPTFRESAGASLNRAVNALADVLHALAVEAGLPGPAPDVTPPALSITSPADGQTFAMTPIAVAGTAGDSGGSGLQRVDVRSNGGGWTTAAGTSSWTASVDLASGSNRIEARAWDGAGNPSSVVTVTVTYAPGPGATTSPTVEITSPGNGSVVRGDSVTVRGIAWDNVAVERVELSRDGATWALAQGTTSWSGVVDLRAGPNTIFARAIDAAGNTAVASITVVAEIVAKEGNNPWAFAITSAVIALVVAIAVLAAVVRRRRLSEKDR